ncbi:MAG: hypothetical protein HW416_3485, partial [Chloroflexi bacterium]|nr:hypothetical protein [Chloroflexota bacterium]
RAIDFFRKGTGHEEPSKVSIRKIREALNQLGLRGVSREQLSRVVAVSRAGQLYIDLDAGPFRADAGAQGVSEEVLPLVRPYGAGPDLFEPRPRLRIIPGKLQGEPHLLGTRIASATIYGLRAAEYSEYQILYLYPEATGEAVRDAIDLERSLDRRVA